MSALRFKAQTTEAVTGDTFNAFSPLSALRGRARTLEMRVTPTCVTCYQNKGGDAGSDEQDAGG